MNASIKKPAIPNITSWQSIDWQQVEWYVEGLQQRIYHAEDLGENRRVRDLQRMLINSQSALLISIRRVTQINKGKRTAGVDGYKALTPEERLELYAEMNVQSITYQNPKPAYRTYIKKKNGKLRPLGIPTIKDRVYQNIVKMALEPQWEARFEATSYGFRPKRDCHDAIERIFNTIKGGKKQWIFEGDFKGCFDNLNHEFIIRQLKGFPQIEIIEKWLKAGYVDDQVFNETESGTPQGGIISPLLANIALHGMEEILGIKYKEVNARGNVIYVNMTKKYAMSKYADDFVIMCETKEDAEDIYEILKPYLQSRGLELALDKTRIINISDGFDFLGFNIRKYKTENGDKILIKPSKDSIKKFKGKISQTTKDLNGENVQTLINTLNPIIIGTANYWSSVVSKETYTSMDNHIWTNIYTFLRRLHPEKSWDWIKGNYFKPDITGQSKNKWILTDPLSNNQLKKMSWTPIVRHAQIKYTYSPYNKELTDYFLKRDIKKFDRNNVAYRQKLAKKQDYKCPLCGMSVTDYKEGLETHHKKPKVKGGSDEYKNLQLVHISCHIEYHKIYPAKREIPTKIQVKTCLKEIKIKKTAGII